MNQSSDGCAKKVSSVNLDKLINDFAQIEKVRNDTKQLYMETWNRFCQWWEMGRKKKKYSPKMSRVKAMEMYFAKPFLFLGQGNK